MRNCLHTWLGLLVGTGLGCLTAQAIRPEPGIDQFSNIPERNVFGLKSGPAAPAPAPKGPPPNITLTGITTLLGNKLALMRVAEPASAGKPAQEKPLMLSEGQREGNVEVLEINEKQGSVRVNDAGEVMTLTFAKNGVKSATAGTVTTSLASPRSNYLGSPFVPGGRMRVLPTRTPRTPVTSAAPETGAAATGSTAPETSATATSDRALSPTGYTNGYVYPASNQTQLSPEAQALLEALSQAASESNTPAPAPLPPALAPPPGSPYPSMPPGASLQRQQPPIYPQ